MQNTIKLNGKSNMQTQTLKKIESSWGSISKFFTYPMNESEYHEKVKLMESLLERDYPDDHPIFLLINLLGEMIDKYELDNFSELKQLEDFSSNLSAAGLLQHLMNEYKLKQKDLIEIFGSQGHVSDILNGKRELNLRHIKDLSKRFNIKPGFFL